MKSDNIKRAIEKEANEIIERHHTLVSKQLVE